MKLPLSCVFGVCSVNRNYANSKFFIVAPMISLPWVKFYPSWAYLGLQWTSSCYSREVFHQSCVKTMTDNKDNVNWSRFGLDPVGRSEPSPPRSHGDQSVEVTASGSTSCGNPNVKDLFDEDQVRMEKMAGNERKIRFCCQFLDHPFSLEGTTFICILKGFL